MTIETNHGKIILKNGAIGSGSPCCCCQEKCVRICCSAETNFNVACDKEGILARTVKIPEGYSLPVEINIRGSVNDDLLIDGKSITTDLMLDPGLVQIVGGPFDGEFKPYPDTWGCKGHGDGAPCCVGSHVIGSVLGPFSDAVRGGITFPMSKREFTVSVRDTVGAGAGLDILICVDPNCQQSDFGAADVTGSCLDQSISGDILSVSSCEGCVPNGTPCTFPKYCRCDASSRIYPPLQFGRTATYECADVLLCNSGTLTPQYFSCCSDNAYADGSPTQAGCESNGYIWSTHCALFIYQYIVKLHGDCPPDVAGVVVAGSQMGCTSEAALRKSVSLADYKNLINTLDNAAYQAAYAAMAPIDPRDVSEGGDVDYAYKLECMSPLDPTQIECQCPFWETGPGLASLPDDGSIWNLDGGCRVTGDLQPAYKIVNGSYAGWYITVRFGIGPFGAFL